MLDLLPSTRNADYARFTQFYSQLQTLQRAIQTAQRAPNDIAAHRAVATLWKGRGQPQFALPEYQIVLNLAPFDYDAQKNIALINLQLLQTDDAQRALIAAAAIAPAAEKPFWQNLQMALNDYKAQRYDSALKFAQAALALATEADKNAVNAYVNKIQELFSTSKK
ncbi:MAG: hypothetical protein HY257_06455 [Chloroflexi bacterium]|nr:hypothetical protein [Chloroflexota bacterium]